VERVLPEPPNFLFIIGIFGKILYKHFLFVPDPDDLDICLKDGSRWDQRQLEKAVMRITCVNAILPLFMTQYASVLSSRRAIFIHVSSEVRMTRSKGLHHSGVCHVLTIFSELKKNGINIVEITHLLFTCFRNGIRPIWIEKNYLQHFVSYQADPYPGEGFPSNPARPSGSMQQPGQY
jgi:hypothetical protein